MTRRGVVPAGKPPVRFVILESASTGAALVVDRLSGMLRNRRDTDGPGGFVAAADLLAGQVVVIADASTGRVLEEAS